MVLGRGFEFQHHPKLDGNDGPLDGRKANKNNKDSQIELLLYINIIYYYIIIMEIFFQKATKEKNGIGNLKDENINSQLLN